jgi:hypothetical protein
MSPSNRAMMCLVTSTTGCVVCTVSGNTPRAQKLRPQNSLLLGARVDSLQPNKIAAIVATTVTQVILINRTLPTNYSFAWALDAGRILFTWGDNFQRALL